jgi:hypothetical protein
MPRAAEISHLELVQAVLESEYRPVDGSVTIVREKRAGKDPAIAVGFEQGNGAQRRGLIGLCRHPDGMWQPSGAFMGSLRVSGPHDVFMTYGGWGSGGSKERAVLGGWVADPAAETARLIDVRTGGALEDEVVNGVVIFMHRDGLALPFARVELLDSEHRVLRAGPVTRRPR